MYHAHLPANFKDNIVKEFSGKMSKIRILISTVAFGMGIDVRDIKRIIHWGPPNTVEEYWQEVGRCCRDGSQGEAIMYKVSGSVNKLRTKDCMLSLLSSTECIRSNVLQTFQFSTVQCNKLLYNNNEQCCSRCQNEINK